jgi:hypothetical protein
MQRLSSLLSAVSGWVASIPSGVSWLKSWVNNNFIATLFIVTLSLILVIGLARSCAS